MFLISKDYWEVRKTKRKGRGVFALKPIPKGAVIGDYVGKLIHIKDIDFVKERRNLYLMSYTDEIGIYPDLKKPGVHLVNHSCSPNCSIYKYKDHTLIFVLRNIQKGEELTITYLLPPKTNCKNCTHICYCVSKNCTGSMHLTEKRYKKWRNFQDRQENEANKRSIKNSRLEPLSDYPKLVRKSYIAKIKNLGVV